MCERCAHFVSAVAFSQVICDNDSSPARKRERATFRSHCLGSWLVRFDLGHAVPDIPDRWWIGDRRPVGWCYSIGASLKPRSRKWTGNFLEWDRVGKTLEWTLFLTRYVLFLTFIRLRNHFRPKVTARKNIFDEGNRVTCRCGSCRCLCFTELAIRKQNMFE